MARELLNTLYVTTQGAYVHADHETLRVEAGDETILRVPVHHLGSVVFSAGSVYPPKPWPGAPPTSGIWCS